MYVDLQYNVIDECTVRTMWGVRRNDDTCVSLDNG